MFDIVCWTKSRFKATKFKKSQWLTAILLNSPGYEISTTSS